MTIILVVIIFLAVGVGFLLFYLIRSGILGGKTSAAKGNLDKSKNLQAIKSARSAVEKDPKDAEAHFYLGKALLADGRNEQALREFKSVSRLGLEGKNIPETEFRQTIAKLYAQFKEPEEALKEYLLLIKSQPENAEYYYNAATIFSSRNKGDVAENYFKKAISLNPKDPRYYTDLGTLLYLSKKTREAGATLEEALKLDPNNLTTHFYMGKVLKDSKEFAASLPYFEKAARAQEFKVRALVETGSCYMSLKMIDKAIVELERAVKLSENDTETDSLYALYFLGMCYEKKQDFPMAVAQWEKLYAIKKNFRDVGEKLVQYQDYRHTGQT
jgi:tetratricopeptide (TPR) repeat protein